MSDIHYLGLGVLFALLASCGDDGSVIRNEQSSGSQPTAESTPPAKCEVYQSRDRVVIQCPELVKMCRASNNNLICEDLIPQ